MEAAAASTLWWVLSIGMIVVGIAGTVLPALPGTALVFAGILLGAWIDDFAHVSGWTVGLIALLAAAAFAVDYLAAVLGARKVGASRLALLGAAAGTVAGLFSGLVGLLFMPLLGAMVGEYISLRRNPTLADAVVDGSGVVIAGGGTASAAGRRAAHVGLATWVGLLVGTIAKVVLVFTMVGVFVAALLIG